jgi:hypothetical protein
MRWPARTNVSQRSPFSFATGLGQALCQRLASQEEILQHSAKCRFQLRPVRSSEKSRGRHDVLAGKVQRMSDGPAVYIHRHRDLAVAQHLPRRRFREEAGSHRMPPSCAKTLSPGLTELSMGFERVASNHQGVDFAGPIEDLEGLAVSKQSLHAAAVVDAHGTEDLDRFDGVPHGRVGAE